MNENGASAAPATHTEKVRRALGRPKKDEGKYPFTPSNLVSKITAWVGKNGLSLCWSWC